MTYLGQLLMQDGIEQGIEQGIEAFILDNLEEKVPMERIIAKLERRFKLTTQQAQEYYAKYAVNP